jgi:hypothetical protein
MYTRKEHFIINKDSISNLFFEENKLQDLLKNYVLKCEQSFYSEMINLNNSTKTRNAKVIRRELQSANTTPFMFIFCLN